MCRERESADMAVFGCSCCGSAICQNPEHGLWSSDRRAAPQAITADVSDGLDSATTASASQSGPDFADSVPGGTASAATLTIGSTVDVTIETPSDHDWYQVTLTAGTTYTIHTTTISGGGSPDSFLTLRDSSGAMLVDDDDSGDGTFSLINFTATTTGTYFVDAGTFAGSGQSSSGSYHLSIAAVLPTGTDPVAATVATTGALALSGSIDGNIDTSGDHDWYAITLVAGQTYIFRTGATAPAGAVDTTLTLRDASGTQRRCRGSELFRDPLHRDDRWHLLPRRRGI
jgi:serralysin